MMMFSFFYSWCRNSLNSRNFLKIALTASIFSGVQDASSEAHYWQTPFDATRFSSPLAACRYAFRLSKDGNPNLAIMEPIDVTFSDPAHHAMCISAFFTPNYCGVGRTCFAYSPLGGAGSCYPGSTLDQSGQCNVAPKNLGTGCATGISQVGNPISVAIGNKFQVEIDSSIDEGTLGLIRYYNSATPAATKTWMTSAPWGVNWGSNFSRSISSSESAAYVYRPDGKVFNFDYVASTNTWRAQSDVTDRLDKLASEWRYTNAAGEVEIYNLEGKLQSITSRTGYVQSLSYSDGTSGEHGGYFLDSNGNVTTSVLPAGLLIAVNDSFNRNFSFGYNVSSQIIKALSSSGNAYRYTYDGDGNLVSVRYPDNKQRSYLYGETAHLPPLYRFSNALTGIVDENESRFATFQYDTFGRAVSSEHAGEVGKVSITYNSDNTATVISKIGAVTATATTYAFQTVQDVVKTTSMSQPCSSGCGAASAIIYDVNGNIDTKTDFNGNVTKYTYDLTRNLETSRTEAFGTPKARTIITTWHPNYRLPDVITEPGKTTDYDYDTNGNILTKTIKDIALNKTRVWTYTYNNLGQVLTEDGPRTDVVDKTNYTYYVTTVAGQYTKGDLATITNAAGHVTLITQYDGNGRPLSITDPNGVVTTLTYWPRGWLKTRIVNGVQTTSYDYDGVGQLTKLTQPDGSYLSYTYDTAHRLTDITDNLGNKIHYTLDAMSNRTKEETFDPTNALKKVLSREYDALNRLKKDIGGTNPTTQVTQYSYDSNGNLTTTTDPLNRVTSNAFDALDRLTQVTNANNGIAKQGYNALDQQTSVTDPRNLVTNYTPNALGDVGQLQSPDTGTTNNVYDAAGNLTQKTDARGVVTAYAYDALNRLISITYPANTAENVSFTYDSVAGGNKGIGRLTGYSNAGDTTTLKYDAYGNVIEQADLIGSQIYTTAYQYDSANRVSQITYPSGRVVVYGRNTIGQVNLVQTRDTAASPLVTLVNTTDYEPFGPIKSLTYGNGVVTALAHDLDYRVSRITTSSIPVWDFVYGYDAAGSIKTITDQVSTFSRTLDYDVLYRLITDGNNTGTWTYQYDANSNRTQKVSNGGTQTLSYLATSNRINKWGSTTQGYDAAGNLTSNGTKTYAYNSAGRLLSYTSSGTLKAQMKYNALGQRTQKLNISKPLHQHYDRAGHYLATTSFNTNGTIYQRVEWVYLDDMPIAQVRTLYTTSGSVSSRRTDYIHVDHLNTPRLMTDTAKKLVWRLDGDAFGQTLPNQNPDGDSTSVTLDLRFPGQLYDVETGFFYNMNRDYDPFLGRYIERDPVGYHHQNTAAQHKARH